MVSRSGLAWWGSGAKAVHIPVLARPRRTICGKGEAADILGSVLPRICLPWARPMLGLLVLELYGGGGCGRATEAPSPRSRPQGDPAPVADPVDSALPAERPEQLEIELRRRTDDGDDVVLKLTPAGARYGHARGKARVALSYRPSDADLDEVYALVRREGFDRIETAPRPDAPPTDQGSAGGTSLRVIAGPGRYSASAMGRRAPAPEHAEAYARCVAAVESLLPQGRGDVVIDLRWDPSMADHAAALDMDVGDDFVGLHRVSAPDAPPHWALHLARPRALELRLRHGSPPTATTIAVPPGPRGDVLVTFDAEQDAVVASLERRSAHGHASSGTSPSQ